MVPAQLFSFQQVRQSGEGACSVHRRLPVPNVMAWVRRGVRALRQPMAPRDVRRRLPATSRPVAGRVHHSGEGGHGEVPRLWGRAGSRSSAGAPRPVETARGPTRCQHGGGNVISHDIYHT
eukprot:gene13917-biopygen12598